MCLKQYRVLKLW